MGGLMTLRAARTAAGGGGGGFSTVRSSFAITGDSDGWNGWTSRERVLASSLTDVSATQLRISWKASSAFQLKIAKAYVQLKGAGTYDFSTTPVQILFSGGSSAVVAANGVIVSDAVTFTYDGTSDLIVSTYSDATAGFSSSNSNVRSTLWQKSGDDAATVTPVGGATGSAMDIVWLIEAS